MSKPNYRQIYEIKEEYRKQLLKLNPDLDNNSGIYFLTRRDIENPKLKYFYIGQSLHILDRMISHCMGHQQHIDISIYKRKFYSEENPGGWKVGFLHYPKEELDKWEQYWIERYMEDGWQARYNKTAGGQGEGKEKINEYRPQKGYRDGLLQGRKNLAKELSDIIQKHLTVSIKQGKENNKVSQRQFEKFKNLLELELELEIDKE